MFPSQVQRPRNHHILVDLRACSLPTAQLLIRSSTVSIKKGCVPISGQKRQHGILPSLNNSQFIGRSGGGLLEKMNDQSRRPPARNENQNHFDQSLEHGIEHQNAQQSQSEREQRMTEDSFNDCFHSRSYCSPRFQDNEKARGQPEPTGLFGAIRLPITGMNRGEPICPIGHSYRESQADFGFRFGRFFLACKQTRSRALRCPCSMKPSSREASSPSLRIEPFPNQSHFRFLGQLGVNFRKGQSFA